MTQSEPTDTWNPAQYTRYRTERSQPFFDLLALVRPRPGMRVLDLGCGTGELTGEMHRILGAAETVGVDNSLAMLAESAALAGNGLRFEQADLRAFATRPEAGAAFDLVLSNAALQWIPEQAAVIESLTGLLAPDGQLAVQVPANEDHRAYVVAREVAAEPPFGEALAGHVRRFSNLTPEGYAVLLDRLGFGDLSVRLQVYPHRLPSRSDVVEWVRGSLLTDYEKRLSPEMYAAFLDRYRERLLPQLDDTHPFFYPFKRILVWGQRPG